MNTYKLDYATDNSLDTIPGMGRSLLQVYTGNRMSENEAKMLMRRIADHKWHVSQKLNPDVGFHVAAIDYVENFYEPQTAESSTARFIAKTGQYLQVAIKKYLIAKGDTLPI